MAIKAQFVQKSVADSPKRFAFGVGFGDGADDDWLAQTLDFVADWRGQ